MNDTPETLVAWRAFEKDRQIVKLLKHAIRMERERDEAREQRDGYQLEIQIVIERLKGNRHPDDNGMKYEGEIDVKSIISQRDRLAAVLQRIRDGYGGQVASPNCCEDCDYLLPIDEALQSLTNFPQTPAK
jgi:hypothetical protein